MARYAYTGRLTDFKRSVIPSGAAPRLYVQALQPAYGGLGLLANRRIPVALETDGSFSVSLEASSSVRPEARYELVAEWVGNAGVPQGYSRFAVFRAPIGGGNIADLVDLPAPSVGGILYGYGPPPAGIPTNCIYLDLSGVNPVVHGPEGANT